MKIKTSIAIGLAILLTTIVSIFLVPTLEVSSSQNFVQTEIPVVVKPLKAGDDVFPVEIQCEPVIVTKADTLDRFTCVLINKTNKSISASSVRYSVIFDSNGKEVDESHLDTLIPYIHPDLSDIKKPIKPGGRLSITPVGKVVKSDSVIKRLEIEPVYIEFSDGTTAGVGGKNAEMIMNVREGATKYKNSLHQEYLKRGKSVQAILPLLADDASLDSETLNFQQQVGAKAYRKSLLKKYEKDGLKSIKKVLQQ